MTRLTILAFATFAALLATQISALAADAKAPGNHPQASHINGNSGLFRLVVAQGETSIVRQRLEQVSFQTVVEVEEEIPEVADFSDVGSECWHLRPAVREALRRSR